MLYWGSQLTDPADGGDQFGDGARVSISVTGKVEITRWPEDLFRPGHEEHGAF